MRRVCWLSLLLFVVAVVVFSRALVGDFLFWDDNFTVSENPHVQALTGANLRWMLTTCAYPPRYVPLSWLSFALNYQVAGLNPLFFHLTDLVFHGANTVLVFLFIRQVLILSAANEPALDESRWATYAAAIGSGLWAVHPLRVEAVAWISPGRYYTESMFFLLLCLLFYVRFNEEQSRSSRLKFYWMSFVAFAISLLIYPIGITALVLLVTLDFFPLKRLKPGVEGLRDTKALRIWREKIPFAVLSILLLGITLIARATKGLLSPPPTLEQFGLAARLAQAFYVWAYYLWKVWIPFGLSPVYTTLVQFNPSSWPFLASAGLITGITVALLYKRSQWPWALGLWGSYLVLLVPMLGLTELPHYTSDRYSYLPDLVWAVLLSAALFRSSAVAKLRSAAVFAALILGLFWASLTFHQIRIWRDSVTLFQYMLTTVGDRPSRANIHWRLGWVLAKQHQIQQAVEHYQTSLKLHPGEVPYLALGTLLEENGDPEGALTNYLGLLMLRPNPHDNLRAAHVLLKLHRDEEAVYYINRSLQLDQNGPQTFYYLGLELLKLGRLDEATSNFNQALRLSPEWPDAHFQLGCALAAKGATPQAIAEYRRTLELKPDSAAAMNNLAWILATSSDAGLREGREAARLAEEACRRTSWKQTIFVGTLAAAYAEAGQFDMAVATSQKACKLASALGETNLLQRNKELLRQFKNHRPCREPNPTVESRL